MNGSRAKKIRREIYGDGSRRHDGRYGIIQRAKTILRMGEDNKPKEIKLVSGQLVCKGKRAEYKKAKRTYMRSMRATA